MSQPAKCSCVICCFAYQQNSGELYETLIKKPNLYHQIPSLCHSYQMHGRNAEHTQEHTNASLHYPLPFTHILETKQKVHIVCRLPDIDTNNTKYTSRNALWPHALRQYLAHYHQHLVPASRSSVSVSVTRNAEPTNTIAFNSSQRTQGDVLMCQTAVFTTT